MLYGILQALRRRYGDGASTESTYVVFTTLYALITGLTYAGFTAFVLEAMGLGAAAHRYNVFASLSNTQIYYMTRIDGWAHTRGGPGGMLHTGSGVRTGRTYPLSPGFSPCSAGDLTRRCESLGASLW